MTDAPETNSGSSPFGDQTQKTDVAVTPQVANVKEAETLASAATQKAMEGVLIFPPPPFPSRKAST
jgi:hypothetical protein